MGFKFGKCKQLQIVGNQAFRNTGADFVDFEGCEKLEQLRGGAQGNTYGPFNNCPAIRTISLKNCALLNWIGDRTFNFYKVNHVFESIDFTGCTGLKTIGAKCFGSNIYESENTTLKKVDLSPCVNLETIGICFMPNFTALEEVDMHGLTKLNSFCDTNINQNGNGFRGCSNLKTVNLTGCDSLEYIPRECFHNCVKLEEVVGWDDIKGHIKSIHASAFGYTNLLNLDISGMPELTLIGDTAFMSATAQKQCPNNCPSLVTIGQSAFQNCTNLGLNDDGTHATLDLHNNTNLTTIGNSAFEGVKAIETINLDNDTSLATLGNKCFYNNTELKHFYARNCTSLTSIGSSMFQGSSKLEDVYFSGCPQITIIPSFMFSGLQTAFWMADFQDSPIVEIGASAFMTCKNLKTFKFVNSKLKKIGSKAFQNVIRADIDQIDFEMDTCDLLDSYAFQSSTIIKSLSVINGGAATVIGNGAFYQCPNLLTVSITNVHTLTTIKSTAFYQAPQLISVDLSGCDGLTIIDNNVCNSDYKLTTFKIQDSPLQAIGQFAFINCVRLEAFDADSSKFSDYTWTEGSVAEKNSSAINIQAFEYCTSLKTFKINIDPDNDCHLMRSAFAGWRDETAPDLGGVIPTYPHDIYIYGSVPPSVPAHGTNFINGANNNGCQFTIHLSSAAEAAYKAAATLEEGVATDGRQFYWCCSDGSAKTATHNTGYWYGNPSITYEDYKLPTIVFDL